jgi:thioredoxin-related protein
MRFYLLFIGILFTGGLMAQDTYHPNADARRDIDSLVVVAALQKKYLLIQVGGNWCIWCRRFDTFAREDTAVNHLLGQYFVYYHLNYSPENKNLAVLAALGHPERFGFPVFVVLDAKGKRLHTQHSGLLKNRAHGYDQKKVILFLENWVPFALRSNNYKK